MSEVLISEVNNLDGVESPTLPAPVQESPITNNTESPQPPLPPSVSEASPTATDNVPRAADELEALQQFDAELNALSKNLDVLAVNSSAPTVSCPGCKEQVLPTDTRLVVKDFIFHENCFKCTNCSTLFSNVVPFIEQDNSYFCEPCHEKKFGMFCGFCDQLIVGKVLKAMNKTWHPNHFTCFSCKKPFEDPNAAAQGKPTNIEYIEKENNPYCASCYKDMFLPKCTACNKAIENMAINALNGKWHEACFKCQVCDVMLNKEVYALNNKPCCKRHFYEHNGNICTVCNDIIDKEFVSINDKKLHVKCFTCFTCKSTIDDSYYTVDGHFYCPKDVQSAMAEYKKKKMEEKAKAAAV